MSGVVSGGWSFVIAAYGLTTLFLTIYTVSVILRYRTEVRRKGDSEVN